MRGAMSRLRHCTVADIVDGIQTREVNRSRGLRLEVYTAPSSSPTRGFRESEGRSGITTPGCTTAMRLTVTLILMVTLCPVGRADGSPVRFRWPLRPVPPVTRAFDAPSPDWQHGHRGWTWPAPRSAGLPRRAGTVVFAGLLAGRAVVSVAHPGGLRTSYEPVESGQAFGVRPGQLVDVDTPMGRLLPGHPGCRSAACLHWGAMWGPACALITSTRWGCWPTPRSGLKPLGIRLATGLISGSRVGLVVHRPQPGHCDVGVELRGGQRRVAQQFLHHAQIGAAFE